MKKTLLIFFLALLPFGNTVHSESVQDTSIYLLTINPGTEIYSIYGHSALRVVIPALKSDIVYNWGVFDFSTPNFAWKFAKGRLNYLLDAEDFNSFMGVYLYEKRSVFSQKINLSPSEIKILLTLIQKNLLPENRSYRYDFFYDDCSTRIRDLIEKAVGNILIYPPEEFNKNPTFRKMVGEFQKNYLWLNMGIDLLMGTPGEAKASFRDMMFLPLYLQKNLTQTVINRNRRMVPLLSNSEVLLEYDIPVRKASFYTTPVFLFTILFIVISIFSVVSGRSRLVYIMDLLLFSIYSIIGALMIFFNFFTDHIQMKLNANLIWFNPIIFICLLFLIMRKPGEIWFRLVFYLSVSFIPALIIFPYAINISFLPVILILILRSSVRSNFNWNPL